MNLITVKIDSKFSKGTPIVFHCLTPTGHLAVVNNPGRALLKKIENGKNKQNKDALKMARNNLLIRLC